MVGEPVLEDDRRWISTNPCTLPENYSAAVRLGFSRGTHGSLGRAGQRATQAFDSNWLLRWLSLVASQYEQQLHVLQVDKQGVLQVLLHSGPPAFPFSHTPRLKH